jgi:hypothetical protein
MHRLLLIVALAPCGAFCAQAEETPLFGGFADVITSHAFNEGDGPTVLDEAPVPSFIVGGLTISLEQTAMADIAKVLGGTVYSQGEAGGALDWTCYDIGNTSVTFYSDGEMGDGLATAFAVETGPSEPRRWCAQLPSDTAIDLGIPSLGSTVDEVVARFGPPAVDGDLLGYGNIEPIEQPAGFSIWQDLTYRQQDGIITAVGVDQMTGD